MTQSRGGLQCVLVSLTSDLVWGIDLKTSFTVALSSHKGCCPFKDRWHRMHFSELQVIILKVVPDIDVK